MSNFFHVSFNLNLRCFFQTLEDWNVSGPWQGKTCSVIDRDMFSIKQDFANTLEMTDFPFQQLSFSRLQCKINKHCHQMDSPCHHNRAESAIQGAVAQVPLRFRASPPGHFLRASQRWLNRLRFCRMSMRSSMSMLVRSLSLRTGTAHLLGKNSTVLEMRVAFVLMM